jgi:hypothetical protein
MEFAGAVEYGGFTPKLAAGGTVTKDDIGDRGQLLLGLLLTDLCGRDVPYFRPRFLGDKYPTSCRSTSHALPSPV